jgi:hypothetical protein
VPAQQRFLSLTLFLFEPGFLKKTERHVRPFNACVPPFNFLLSFLVLFDTLSIKHTIPVPSPFFHHAITLPPSFYTNSGTWRMGMTLSPSCVTNGGGKHQTGLSSLTGAGRELRRAMSSAQATALRPSGRRSYRSRPPREEDF